MKTQVAKLLTTGGVALMLSSMAWSQNMLPEGDFESVPAPPTATLPAGMIASPLSVSGTASGSTWFTESAGLSPTSTKAGEMNGVFSGPLGGTVQAVLGVTPTTTPFQANTQYTVRFTAASNLGIDTASSLTLNWTGATVLFTSGNFTSTSGSSVTISNTNVGGSGALAAQDNYYIRFLTGASPNASFNFTGGIGYLGGAGATAQIFLDNVSIVNAVPEINAAAGTIPVALFLGALLLAHDLRRKSNPVTSYC